MHTKRRHVINITWVKELYVKTYIFGTC